MGVVGRPQHFGGIEVDDKRSPCSLAGSVKTDHAGDVLRGCRDQGQTIGLAEQLDQALFNLGLGRKGKIGIKAAEAHPSISMTSTLFGGWETSFSNNVALRPWPRMSPE